jgi:hypothetical protein
MDFAISLIWRIRGNYSGDSQHHYHRKTWSLRPTECFGFSTIFGGWVLLPKCETQDSLQNSRIGKLEKSKSKFAVLMSSSTIVLQYEVVQLQEQGFAVEKNAQMNKLFQVMTVQYHVLQYHF